MNRMSADGLPSRFPGQEDFSSASLLLFRTIRKFTRPRQESARRVTVQDCESAPGSEQQSGSGGHDYWPLEHQEQGPANRSYIRGCK